MVEEMDLDHFRDAYAHVTGRSLIPVASGERPDFICRWGRAKPVGVELTYVPIGPFGLSFSLCDAATAKASKLKSPDWTLADRTILVLMVQEPLRYLDGSRDPSEVLAEFKLGFIEIWAADYSLLDAYSNIELFGLYPRRWFGFHRRPNWSSKPYG